MLTLEDYPEATLLFEGPSFSVFRAIEPNQDQAVLVKTSRSDAGKKTGSYFLEQDFEIGGSLHASAVLKPRRLLRKEGRSYLILEDAGCIPLKKYLQDKPLYPDPLKAVNIFSDITRSVGQLHRENLIHRGLNPLSLFIHPETNDIRITGFGFSTFQSDEGPEFDVERYEIEDMVYYISPEQTGRMNRVTDHRTDIYSLGIIFFECLTRQLPFPHSDTMAMVHSHLAEPPPEIRSLNPEMPACLSALVQKMLDKNARERYQSTRGLLSDLDKCRQFMEEGKTDLLFPLGEEDISDVLRLPEKSFGREKEQELLVEAFSRVGDDGFEAAFVSGPSGIGKSTLIREAKVRSGHRSFYFLSGTYKNFNRNVPFSAFIGAIREGIEQVLAAPEEVVAAWRVRLRQALGNQGRLITNMIPELEVLIGPQPELSLDVTPEEAENRLKYTFLNFIQAMTRSEKGVVLFLDDLHLADFSSIDFLRTILSNPDTKNLLLIGAWVDDSLTSNQGLSDLMGEVRGHAGITEIHLGPLSRKDLSRLIQEILPTEGAGMNAVIELIHDKTKGIPIFIHEFLLRIEKEGALRFDYGANVWRWDRGRMEQMPVSDNVADLMLGKVQELPEQTLHLLKLAACIGAVFDLATLAYLSDNQPEVVSQSLREAMAGGYISRLPESVLSNGAAGPSAIADAPTFRFAHDRLHQALYSLIDTGGKEKIHYRIARFLLDRKQPAQLFSNLFEVAHHLDEGRAYLVEGPLVRRAITTFSEAGKQARSAFSYELAYRYLVNAERLESEHLQPGKNQPTFDLYLELLEVAFLAGQPEEGEEWMSRAMALADNRLDQAKVHLTKAMVYIHLSDFKKGFQEGRSGLRLFGLNLPMSPNQGQVLLEIIRVRWALRGKTAQEILDLPEIHDPAFRLIETIYYRCLNFAMSTSKELFALISLRMLRLTLQHGFGPFSYSGFNLYGQLLTVGFGNYQKGYAFMELAMEIARRSGNLQVIAGAQFGMAMGGVFTQPLASCIRYGEEAHENNHLAGAIYYASTITSSLALYYLVLGRPLAFVREKIRHYYAYSRNANQPDTFEFQEACLYLIDKITGDDATSLADPLPQLDHYPNFSEIHRSWYYVLWMKTYYFFGQYDQGISLAEIAEKDLEATFFHLMATEYVYYRALLWARCDRPAGRKRRRNIRQALKLLKKRARYSPENFLHKYLTVRGLHHWTRGKPERAMADFQRALAGLAGDDYIQDRAQLHELAGTLHLADGNPKEAAALLETACREYKRWGGMAPCRRLLEEHRELLAHLTTDTAPVRYESSLDSIDFKSVLKAMQVLSSEIELSQLLTELIRITIENAGAQRGFLIVEKNGRMVIEAEGTIDRREVKTMQRTPVTDDSDIVSAAIVNYVARTKRAVVMADAMRDDKFSQTPYIREKEPKSVTCQPILNQGKLIGILYLENNLTYGAFTPERQEVLQLLSGQAGISLENAYLYARMAELNKAYERFVPKEFLQFLGKESIIDVRLGDNVQKEMTVMFADIRNFTSISEKLSPQENFQFLNDYLGQMEPIISRYQGFIDKYIGDAIMALFPSEADDALQAAVDMIRQLDTFNRDRTLNVRIGIGLNTGNLMLGTVGGTLRMDGTVISDAVNLAARVERMTKHYGLNLIITDTTYQRLRAPERFTIRKLDQVAAKGRATVGSIFEVCDADPPEERALKRQSIPEFEEAVSLFYQQKRQAAQPLFEKIVRDNPADHPARIFLERCREELGD